MVFTEAADDLQMLRVTFDLLDTNKDGVISLTEILDALSDPQNQGSSFINFADTLEILKRQLSTDSEGIDYERFKQAMGSVPRVYGHRIQWARSLRFENVLANLLSTGPIFDPLRAIKKMPDHKILESLTEASKEVFEKFKRERDSLIRAESGSSDEVADIMGKYTGETGKFGDTGMFEEGLENQIGNPDPYILKGIIRENAIEDGCDKLSVTPNYLIKYSPLHEYSRLLGHPSEYEREKSMLNEEDLKDNENIPTFLLEVAKGCHQGIKGPTLSELKELKTEFAILRECCEENIKMSKKSVGQAVFAGDIGYVQKSMQLKIKVADTATANKMHAVVSGWSGDAKGSFISAGFPPPSPQREFTVSVFGSFIFFSAEDDAFVERSLKELVAVVAGADALSEVQRSDVVYIYCKLEHQDGMESTLKDLLQRLNSAVISRISGLDGVSLEEHISAIVDKARGLRLSSGSGICTLSELLELLQKLDFGVLSHISGVRGSDKDDHMSVIIRKVLDPGSNTSSDPRVVLVQGRGSLRLRDLMYIPEVTAAELRVEEAIQAHQYTGPLYQVSWFSPLRETYHDFFICRRPGMAFSVACPSAEQTLQNVSRAEKKSLQN